MADEQPAQSRPKRRVKNPETFRERAIKANQVTEKPGRTSKLRDATGKLAKPASSRLQKTASSKKLGPVRKVLRVIGKVLLPTYVRNSWKELRQVTWPTWKQSRKLTLAVMIFAIIFGALIAIVDYGLDKLFRHIFIT
jgi:preprotein translocase SecE subunit